MSPTLVDSCYNPQINRTSWPWDETFFLWYFCQGFCQREEKVTHSYNDDHRRQCNYEKTYIFAFKTTGYRGPLNAREEHYRFENHFMSFVSTCPTSDAWDLKKIPTFFDEVNLTLLGCQWYWRVTNCLYHRDTKEMGLNGRTQTHRIQDKVEASVFTALPWGNVNDCTSLLLLHPPKRASMLLLLAYQSTDHSLRPVLKSYWPKEFPQNYLNDFQWEWRKIFSLY